MKNNNKDNNQKTAEDLYSKMKIDSSNFKSLDELSADYQGKIQQIQKDSIDKSAYFFCK